MKTIFIALYPIFVALAKSYLFATKANPIEIGNFVNQDEGLSTFKARERIEATIEWLYHYNQRIRATEAKKKKK